MKAQQSCLLMVVWECGRDVVRIIELLIAKSLIASLGFLFGHFDFIYFHSESEFMPADEWEKEVAHLHKSFYKWICAMSAFLKEMNPFYIPLWGSLMNITS